MERIIFLSVTMVQEDVIIQISQRLRDMCTEKRVTLQQLADAAGITKGVLSQIENCRTISSLNVLISLIKGLEIILDEFFSSIYVRDGQQKVIVRKKEN
ncbi:helix-turn-helix domain-containing protein [Flavisolibacter nicotianae]|uniref:helix-turn-helix domain-containing protein n=1 Tax=Flavisolibacter nicotianae TaxID=2364882 RepID=UPI0013C45150|nr:helix-turn-helix transcriptional regulator [Flavisolibacter nicotianae]